MANLYNTDLGANSRRAQPTTLLGTRQLKFIMIRLYDYNLYDNTTDTSNFGATTSYLDSDSLYCRIVTAIQEVSELYYLGAPSRLDPSAFVFAVADTTGQWQYSDQGDIDYNELGVDETEPDYAPERYDSTGYSGVNDLVDRIYRVFYDRNNNDVYGINDFDVRELEDCGFGLLPGRFLY